MLSHTARLPSIVLLLYLRFIHCRASICQGMNPACTSLEAQRTAKEAESEAYTSAESLVRPNFFQLDTQTSFVNRKSTRYCVKER